MSVDIPSEIDPDGKSHELMEKESTGVHRKLTNS
jgi:hypothetical protein